jgi:hypothetical protein
MKGIIYYMDNNLEEPIFSTVQEQLKKAGLPIVSVSLKPINFGTNIVLNLEPSYFTMLIQLTTALELSSSDVVFFCEHDVLYPLSHFDFTPPRDDIFYYNANVWRWEYRKDRLITYDRLISLSSLCCNRQLALENYSARLSLIAERGYDKIDSHEPSWARKMGYEAGTKKVKRGGFSDDDFETWKSEEAVIDIRHKGTFSPSKMTLGEFKHLPTNWKETTVDKIESWDMKGLFKL